MTQYSSPKLIDIVEIEPAIVTASHFFDKYNHKPLDDIRVKLHLNDARNHLTLSPDGNYDMVSSEPSNPWLSGVSNLFTREFFALGKRKLRSGGVWAQWVQMYGMSYQDLSSLLGTFADTYAHLRVFRVARSDLIVLGSDEPLPLDIERMRRAMRRDVKVINDLGRIRIRQPESLLSLYLFGRETIVKLAAGVERNTDDNMRIEYSAPLHLHEKTEAANVVKLEEMAEILLDLPASEQSVLRLARAYALHDKNWRRPSRRPGRGARTIPTAVKWRRSTVCIWRASRLTEKRLKAVRSPGQAAEEQQEAK